MIWALQFSVQLLQLSQGRLLVSCVPTCEQKTMTKSTFSSWAVRSAVYHLGACRKRGMFFLQILQKVAEVREVVFWFPTLERIIFVLTWHSEGGFHFQNVDYTDHYVFFSPWFTYCYTVDQQVPTGAIIFSMSKLVRFMCHFIRIIKGVKSLREITSHTLQELYPQFPRWWQMNEN